MRIRPSSQSLRAATDSGACGVVSSKRVKRVGGGNVALPLAGMLKECE